MKNLSNLLQFSLRYWTPQEILRCQCQAENQQIKWEVIALEQLTSHIEQAHNKSSKTEMTASVQENKLKKTQEDKKERFLISTRQNNVRIFGIRCRQTDKQI